jgi:glycolate oxidase iron-sulfur subunit
MSLAEQQPAAAGHAPPEAAIRKCVHCGFCTATCPTFVLLGDELDSPRGRIHLMKEMLASREPPAASTVKHIDRCLSCLSCMTTCPSGVNYMHLVDHARAYIEANYRRPLPDRLLRAVVSALLTRPALFRWALRFARVGRPLAALLPGRLKGMARMAPDRLPSPGRAERAGVFAAQGPRRARVAVLAGCAQSVLDPGVNEAAIRLLNRMGVEVVSAAGAGCCGALPHHLGQADRAHALAAANIRAWTAEADREGLDAIIVTTSGCGTPIKDYGYLFRDDPELAAAAARISALAMDVTEFLARSEFAPLSASPEASGLVVAYQAACSLQHGQGVREAPKALLRACGFTVTEPAEPHICCGSAGTYNLLQPEIAGRLRERKVANLEAVRPDVIASGNIGCMTQVAGGTRIPVVHTVELLDWATGGPKPAAMALLNLDSDHG